MTNYITTNANYDLFSTASYAALDTYLKNDAISTSVLTIKIQSFESLAFTKTSLTLRFFWYKQ